MRRPRAPHAAALLARALVARGGLDDVHAALAQAEFAEQHGGEDLRTAIIAASARGEALARMGEDEQALASVRRAVELAEPTDALADTNDGELLLSTDGYDYNDDPGMLARFGPCGDGGGERTCQASESRSCRVRGRRAWTFRLTYRPEITSTGSCRVTRVHF